MLNKTFAIFPEGHAGLPESETGSTLSGPPAPLELHDKQSSHFPTCVRPSTPFVLQHVESTGQSAVLFVVSSPTHVLLVVT